ncbi:MAG TPA: tetratricopeptide repeat protein, partial [Phycisphaerae bacterium]|nr:tetratricopeptide repeat protein [Phycisphaerae bacterium]
MMILDDILIGAVASAIVSCADAIGTVGGKEARAEVEALLDKARRLRSPEERAQDILRQALRDGYARGGLADKLADAVASDVMLGVELAKWALEPDPTALEQKGDALAGRLAKDTGCSPTDVRGFLGRLNERISDHLGLAQFRADQKLNLVLSRIAELADLGPLLERHHLYLARRLQGLLDRDRIHTLTPVCPRPRPPTQTNMLLAGGRPTDQDMDEDIDFRRTMFEPVLTAVRGVTTFPGVFLFHADAQRGKTTFLKRVGWELAIEGYAVVHLAPGAAQEHYARWIIDHAGTLGSLPLVVLIDDAHQNRRHFEDQMTELHDKQPRALLLLAARPEDWKGINPDRAPILRRAAKYDLNPDGTEPEKLLRKLTERGLLEMDDASMATVLSRAHGMPHSAGYLHSVIEIASEERYKPMPVLVAERLAKAGDTEEARAFERWYSFVCVAGHVGLSLPRNVEEHLLTERERVLAEHFSQGMPIAPVRVEEKALAATHETHAARFLERCDMGALLREFVETFVTHPSVGGFLGDLLELMRQRGSSALALDAWDTVAARVHVSHWQAVDANTLAGSWGSLFYHCGRLEDAATVTAIAVEKAPDSAVAHNNLAVLLEGQGDPDRAREHYEEALRINPE